MHYRMVIQLLSSSFLLSSWRSALQLALTIFVLFNISKESFAIGNSICFSFNDEDVEDVQNSRKCTSMGVYKQEKGAYIGHNLHNNAGLKLLLLLAGDVGMCPGPCDRCISCKKKMNRNQLRKVLYLWPKVTSKMPC